MTCSGMEEQQEAFLHTANIKKWKEGKEKITETSRYELYRQADLTLKHIPQAASGLFSKKMLEKLNITIETRQDIIDNMENIRKYVRGHNLYDIFYGRYKGEKENAILRAYIDAAPRENFDDIFDAIDNFVYFNNRKN